MTGQEHTAITVGLELKEKSKKIVTGLRERERERFGSSNRAVFLEEVVFRQA